MNKGRKKWEIISPFPFHRQTLEHGEMEWLSHAVSGSPRKSSKRNLDADFQAAVLFAKPSFQAKAKEMRAATLRQQPEGPVTRWAVIGLYSASPHHLLCREGTGVVWVPVRAEGSLTWVSPGVEGHVPTAWTLAGELWPDSKFRTCPDTQHREASAALMHNVNCSGRSPPTSQGLPVPSEAMLPASSQVAHFGPRGKKNMSNFAFCIMMGTKEQSTLFLKVNTLWRNISELAGLLLWLKKNWIASKLPVF